MSNKTVFEYISPVLASSDVARDIQWYKDKLGFQNVYDSTQYQEGPVDYVVLGRQKLFFHMQFQFPEDVIRTDVKFQVKNIEPLYDEFLKSRAITEHNINRKTDWNTSECCFFDLNRNRLTFYEDI